MRVWFNKTFSSVSNAINLIKQADIEGKFWIISTHTNPDFPSALTAHEFKLEPSGLIGSNYVNWCLEFCIENNIQIFVPGKESATFSSTEITTLFESHGIRIMSSGSKETLDFLENKADFYSHVDLPLAPPADFETFSNYDEFTAAYDRLRAKHKVLCVKPSVGVYALGFSVLDEEKSSTQILFEGLPYRIGLQDFKNGLMHLNNFPLMMVMEYLPGDEYSVDCVADNGKLICAVPRKKSSGIGRGQTIDCRADILTCVEKLADDYKLNGIFNAQFREGENGLSLLEINARMSGGIGMACMAGVNLPFIALSGFAFGFSNILIPPVKNGIQVSEQLIPVILN
jgi:hypothetical protein